MGGIGALGWLAIGESVIKAFVTPWLNKADSDNALEKIGSETDSDTTTLYGQLNKSYEQSKLELQTEFNQKNKALNNAIGYTTSARNTNANFASQSNTKSNQFMYEDLSMMLEDVAGSQGQAVQNAAMTGFRNTGTQAKALSEVEEAKQYQIDRAIETLKLNAAQSFAAASENYFSATSQIEQYRVEIGNLKESLEVAKKGLKLDYEIKKQELAEAAEEAKYEWWEGVLDFLTLGLRGTTDVLSTIDSENMSVAQKDLIDIQINEIKGSNPHISFS